MIVLSLTYVYCALSIHEPSTHEGQHMTIRLGKYLEIEVQMMQSLYVKLGSWERFYNRMGLPDGSLK